MLREGEPRGLVTDVRHSLCLLHALLYYRRLNGYSAPEAENLAQNVLELAGSLEASTLEIDGSFRTFCRIIHQSRRLASQEHVGKKALGSGGGDPNWPVSASSQ